MSTEHRHLIVKTPEEGIVRVTLDRADKFNALSLELLDELCACLEGLDLRPEARVIILDSAGDKAFVAGADIAQMAAMGPLDFRGYTGYLRRLAKVMTSGEKVYIAKVEGVAYGGGNILAMNCDFVFASETSRFGQQEVDFGILGGLPRLMHLIGVRRAWDMVITGRTIGAAEAERIGLITRAMPAEDLEGRVMSCAREIVGRSEIAVRLSKALKKMAERVDLDSAYEYENELISLCFDSPDTKERLARFVKE
ncbi:MAG: enoyl-CoA hydratase/isomerase family protein [Desulfarculaceae bacterium]|nr:enoyl-CoA hydratase/isomerase family protein [Desulfarculaceae bacterium]MCF8071170.1 enoyl-CoA hydratase/isomerase family protein [Desulfarculaceae bacterium]MCF8101227.1 enoyl-CoA hydratase/isomerase family protein [Desulfarculaceae bacterium]MCF8115224.1 enoyl-CoA hydratase/isomerase family protein [Desulfarculaceae bacterium]